MIQLPISKKCKHIDETFSVDNTNHNITAYDVYSGDDFNTWYDAVLDSVWNCCCGQNIDLDSYEVFINRHLREIKFAWYDARLPKQFGKELFFKYSNEF